MVRIVVADNDPDALDLALTDLRLEGHEVHGAHDAAAAHALVLDLEPDVVVLDYRMPPGATGLELAEQLVRESRDVRIVIYSQLPAGRAPRPGREHRRPVPRQGQPPGAPRGGERRMSTDGGVLNQAKKVPRRLGGRRHRHGRHPARDRRRPADRRPGRAAAGGERDPRASRPRRSSRWPAPCAPRSTPPPPGPSPPPARSPPTAPRRRAIPEAAAVRARDTGGTRHRRHRGRRHRRRRLRRRRGPRERGGTATPASPATAWSPWTCPPRSASRRPEGGGHRGLRDPTAPSCPLPGQVPDDASPYTVAVSARHRARLDADRLDRARDDPALRVGDGGGPAARPAAPAPAGCWSARTGASRSREELQRLREQSADRRRAGRASPSTASTSPTCCRRSPPSSARRWTCAA